MKGNNWETFNDDGGHGYRYDNQDGSAYQKNSDGSSVFDNGEGFQQHTSAEGEKSNRYY
ncbi:hypothetical protein CVT26_003652 [Gymnopilus dilepis]|uniref:Uncharacterized protein n=1 Tax=Gymnopilus dilepis TaxID=231916 RepID=A0A409VSG5_9AGAR|nr:hypothetical protein CVT26_003652 [Gymnopilus dilepis]